MFFCCRSNNPIGANHHAHPASYTFIYIDKDCPSFRISLQSPCRTDFQTGRFLAVPALNNDWICTIRFHIDPGPGQDLFMNRFSQNFTDRIALYRASQFTGLATQAFVLIHKNSFCCIIIGQKFTPSNTLLIITFFYPLTPIPAF
jgi:hypothetical protein